MNSRTIRILEDTFDNPFDLTRYQAFARELLNQFEAKPFLHSGNMIPLGYRPYVALFGRVGTYTDPDGKTVDILYIRLRERGQMLRARALQRNFVARHLKNRDKDGALVAFHVDEVDDWRLSLVWRTEEMGFDDEKGKLTFAEQLTPTRRSSYLLGATEPSHTAKQQLLPLLESTARPTLAQLQSLFGVERVTREFFDQYKQLYLQLHDALKEHLAQDAALRRDFAEHAINPHNFAKKLLGQIVFLYFLQKKGWLGVPRDADWQTGSRRFLRDLFEGRHVPYDNFFNDVLEPLFYEALAEQRADDWYATLNCRIPFLNGGLFEPMNGYDWRGTNLALPNALFSNDATNPAGDTGTGILDVFDRYNFTVHEEEPLEKEVAVDPEMLGKVFENLLEVTDRKSKGAFYTPREIVHYMCQESLINYLDTAINYQELPIAPEKPKQASLFATAEPTQAMLTSRQYAPLVPREQLAFLIRNSGLIKADRDNLKAEGRLADEAFQLPELVRTHARLLDKKLAEVKVCDPAIGSGAFPVGMLTEIVRARAVVQEVADGQEPNLYALKRHAIQHSLYGVDVDAAAVDIAQLRLWLSLVVDEETLDNIEPLPNLDYRIVVGNSLIGLPHTSVGQAWRTPKIEVVEGLKERFFSETDHHAKMGLKQEIDQAIRQQLATAKIDFDFKLVFSEVWFENGGFDVVVGNPPYVRHELIKEFKPALQQRYKEVYAGTADLYVYFYARGLQLLKPHGSLAYITSNKFMRAGYGKKLRTYFAKQTTLHSVIDFGDLPVFEATAYPTIVIARQDPPPTDSTLDALTVDSLDILQALPQQIDSLAWPMAQNDLAPTGWALSSPEVLALMKKLRRAGTPLEKYVDGKFYYGIKTGFNEAFVIDEATRARLIAEDPRSAEIIKPWLRGRDIKRWKIKSGELFVILFRSGSDKNITYEWSGLPQTAAEIKFKKIYPAIYNHLSNWKAQLIKRQDQGQFWWELRSCAYCNDFEVSKIIYPDIAKQPEFAFDESGAFGGNTLYIIPTTEKFLLAILNSPVIHFFYDNVSSTVQGGYYRFIATYMRDIPIPPITEAQKERIDIELQVLQMLPLRANQIRKMEKQINAIVYEMFSLTMEEISLIERFVLKQKELSLDVAMGKLVDI